VKSLSIAAVWVFLAVLAMPAQTISNIVVNALSATSFLVEYDASAVVTDFLIEYDTQPVPPFANATFNKHPVTTSASTNGILLSGLAPSTTYYWRLKATLGGTTIYSPVQTTQTAAASSARFTDPIQPNAPDGPVYPASYTTTFTPVNCADIQPKINSAATATAGGNVKLIIPASFDCSNNNINGWTLPATPGPGVVVVTTDTPDFSLPPPGVRATTDWEIYMPKLRLNNFTTSSSTLTWNTTSNGWIFKGIELTEAFPSALVKTLTGVSGGIYTAPSHGYSTGNVVQICRAGVLTRNAEINVVDANTFTVLSESGTGACPNGSWVAREVVAILGLVWMNAGSSNIWFDRCLFKLSYWMPTASRYGVDLWCSNCGVINSGFYNIQAWQPWNARLNQGYAPPGCCYGQTIGVALSRVQQGRFENNLVESPGITLFAEEVDGVAPNAGDMVFRRNLVNWRDELRLGSPTSLGYKVTVRQFLEFKRCERCLIEGNIFRNEWTDGSTGNTGSSLVFTPRCSSGATGRHGSANRIQDITIRYNRLEHVTGFLTALGGETTDRACDVEGTKRVQVKNNVVTSIDGSSIAYVTGMSRVNGQTFYLSQGLEDVMIDNNTIYKQDGSVPAFLLQFFNRNAGLKVRNNLLFMSNDNGSNGVNDGNYASFVPPVINTNASTRMAGLWTAMPTPDPATQFLNNVTIPTVTSTASPANYDNPSYLLSVSTCSSQWAPLMTCVGTNETTGTQRLMIPKFLDVTNGDFGLRHDSPFASGATPPLCTTNPAFCVRAADGRDLGADTDAVDAAAGKVRNVRVVNANRADALIGYTRPADKSCTLEYGTQAVMGTGQRIVDSGPIGSNTVYVPVTVSLSGLAPGTPYHYRLLCPSEQPTGSFVTLP
jgi:hypothetical protein